MDMVGGERGELAVVTEGKSRDCLGEVDFLCEDADGGECALSVVEVIAPIAKEG